MGAAARFQDDVRSAVIRRDPNRAVFTVESGRSRNGDAGDPALGQPLRPASRAGRRLGKADAGANSTKKAAELQGPVSDDGLHVVYYGTCRLRLNRCTVSDF